MKVSTLWMLISISLFAIAGCSQSDEEPYEELTDHERRSAEYALAGLETRDGLETTLFAAEDLVVNPTNMDVDAEGRVWVTEGVNYRPDFNPENPTKEDGDRIVILEDTNGNGRADTSKVFYQGNDINSALGIMVLDNRVFVSRSPHIFVFTDTNGDDRADTKDILFSGIGGEQDDHGVHALVFGPDGKIYFNTGNAGRQIGDAEGNIIKDKFGLEVRADGNPYRQGMVFRSNLNGSEFEVLGHNFRNIYEVAVDSYGTLWQSDNDDDGNRGVRINFVMEYGNYGYTDELTGASWYTRRTGMAEDTPTRHWYQSSPGVVPNLLQTAAGSPTGIVFYEGDLLPEIFRNQMIHADAGPNVIRSYPTEKDGAGYSAHIETLLEGAKDQWFRPSDVTVAPDGSIFVADWYDPGVGGHRVVDQQRGRIFRIAPDGTPYRIPDFDLNTPEGAVEALKSPNHNLRARAWLKLHNLGKDAEPVLSDLWNSENSQTRARALWLLSKLESSGIDYIEQALNDENPDIRITGLRAARQLDVDIIPYLKPLADDPSPQVRREAAVALHRNESSEAAELWTQVALHHTGNDRWYLEALGIGAATQWDHFFDTWLDEVEDWNTPGGRDIIWRSRAETAIPLLAELIKDHDIEPEDKHRYFRAFDFHSSPEKQEQLISILQTSFSNQGDMNLLALNHLDSSALESPVVREELDKTLVSVRETQEYLDLIEKFELESQNEELLNLMVIYPDSSLGIRAGGLILQNDGQELIESVLRSSDAERKRTVLNVLGYAQTSQSIRTLREFIFDEQNEFEIRRHGTLALGSGWGGEQQLFELANNGMIPDSLKHATGMALSDSWRGDVQKLGNELIGEVQTGGGDLPSIGELSEKAGNSEYGREIFGRSCQICHQVNGEGIEFGPALSDIGAKLPKEGLYDSILNPNNGISFGYEGYILTLQDGSQTAGIIRSETATELTLLTPGGYTTNINKSEINNREEMDQSLMPANLHAQMNEQELVDLVEYLTTLE